MKKLFDKYNGRQTVWQSGNNYYICSTAVDSLRPEVMVFTADSNGRVTDYMDLYVSYTDVTNHNFHMAQFEKENNSGA